MKKSAPATAQQQANTRELYSRQPAHSLIIDPLGPCTGEEGQTIATAVQNFFSVVCSLTGPCRIPCFSLLASWHRTEMFLPMQKVSKVLFPRLHVSLQEVLNLIKTESANTNREECDVRRLDLEQAIRESAVNFAKFKELSNFTSQLEITVLTFEDAARMKSRVSNIVRDLNLLDIKKIDFVCLTNNDDRVWSQTIADYSSISQEGLISEEGHDLASLCNVVQLECNAVTIDCYLRQWLKDESTDKEHMRLQIGALTIKCDTQERLLNPDELPFRASFCSSSDLYMCTVPQGSRGQNTAERLPILHFRVKKIVADDVICESIIFGRPVVLVASVCWQMDWDELETNQSHFHALCKRLSNRSECLLCENLTKQQGRHRNYSLCNIDQPKGLFVIMPSKSPGSLLLKYISPRELLLPTRIESISDELEIPESATERIDDALESIDKPPEFNPIDYESGLCESLRASLIPKTPGRTARPVTKKPRLQHVTGSGFIR